MPSIDTVACSPNGMQSQEMMTGFRALEFLKNLSAGLLRFFRMEMFLCFLDFDTRIHSSVSKFTQTNHFPGSFSRPLVVCYLDMILEPHLVP
jgi:hypothetical protein